MSESVFTDILHGKSKQDLNVGFRFTNTLIESKILTIMCAYFLERGLKTKTILSGSWLVKVKRNQRLTRCRLRTAKTQGKKLKMSANWRYPVSVAPCGQHKRRDIPCVPHKSDGTYENGRFRDF